MFSDYSFPWQDYPFGSLAAEHLLILTFIFSYAVTKVILSLSLCHAKSIVGSCWATEHQRPDLLSHCNLSNRHYPGKVLMVLECFELWLTWKSQKIFGRENAGWSHLGLNNEEFAWKNSLWECVNITCPFNKYLFIIIK